VAFGGWAEPDLSLVLPRGVGLAGKAALERRLQTTRDALNDPGLVFTPEVRAHLHRLDVRSAMAVPLLVNGEAIGALGVGRVPAWCSTTRPRACWRRSPIRPPSP
jgi:GAF domain-containing protein